jgi:hypothetical protein
MVTFTVKKGVATMEKETAPDFGHLIVELLHSAIITHLMHWQTTSYSAHVALGDYYNEIPDSVDKLVEAYMGKYGRVGTMPMEMVDYQSIGPVGYFDYLYEMAVEGRAAIPDDSYLLNLYDGILDLISTTRYKLRELS